MNPYATRWGFSLAFWNYSYAFKCLVMTIITWWWWWWCWWIDLSSTFSILWYSISTAVCLYSDYRIRTEKLHWTTETSMRIYTSIRRIRVDLLHSNGLEHSYTTPVSASLSTNRFLRDLWYANSAHVVDLKKGEQHDVQNHSNLIRTVWLVSQ